MGVLYFSFIYLFICFIIKGKHKDGNWVRGELNTNMAANLIILSKCEQGVASDFFSTEL